MSGTVLFVIKSTPSNMFAYDTSYKTLQDMISEIDLTTKLIVCVQYDLDKKKSFLNLSKMLREDNSTSGSTTWEEFGTALEEIDFLLYSVYTFCPKYMLTNQDGKFAYIEVPKGSNIQGGPKIISVEHTQDIEAGYGDVNNPTIRNTPNLKCLSPDVVLSQPTKDVVNFIHTIPIINGVVAYPMFVNKELWAKDSTKYMYSTGGRDSNLIMMDFTSCGGIETIKFHDCVSFTKNDSTNVKFAIPSGISIGERSPILVFGGRMFFSNEFRVIDDRMMSIDLGQVNFKEILEANDLICEDYEYNTCVVRPPSVIDYIKTIFDKDNYENYIILVNNKYVKPCYIEPLSTISRKDYLFPVNAGGLLIRRSTRETIDYIRALLKTNTRVYTDLPYEGKVVLKNSTEDIATNVGFKTTHTPTLRSAHYNFLDVAYRYFDDVVKDLDDRDMVLLDLVVQEGEIPDNVEFIC